MYGTEVRTYWKGRVKVGDNPPKWEFRCKITGRFYIKSVFIDDTTKDITLLFSDGSDMIMSNKEFKKLKDKVPDRKLLDEDVFFNKFCIGENK
jgi:hypothetical protein